MMLWIEKHRIDTTLARDDTYAVEEQSAEERKEMKISLPPVSIPFTTEDEKPQEGDKLQVVHDNANEINVALALPS